MEETRKFKKYIYISTEVKPVIEGYCEKNNIVLVTRFINEYNFEVYFLRIRYIKVTLTNLFWSE